MSDEKTENQLSQSDAAESNPKATTSATDVTESAAPVDEPAVAATTPSTEAAEESSSAAPEAPSVDEAAESVPAATESAASETPAESAGVEGEGQQDEEGADSKLKIGRSTSYGDEPVLMERPQLTENANPIIESSEPVPKPQKHDKLSDDLEKEIADALGGASLDDMIAGDSGADEEQLEADSRRRATVVRLHGDNVFFSLGGRHEGYVSVRQFKEKPKMGDSLDVIVVGYNNDEGMYDIRIPGAAMDVDDWSDIQEGVVVEARVTGANTGGLECMVNTIRGFIPASQVALFRVENFAEYIDKKLPCVVTEANKRRKNLVLSHRALLERDREEERKQQIATLEVGQICEGTVRSVRDFGAFVDIGGVDGLVHVSQLSWDRVEHPSEVVKEGEKVRVRIEKVNKETGKVGLSLRSLQEHPWTDVDSKFPVNSTVKGKVSRIAKFGAFVKVGNGVEGLIHVSELAHHRVSLVSSVVKEGDEVEVKILSIDPKEQRMALSLKALTDAPVKEKGKKEEDEVEEVRELAVKKQNDDPLKGGMDRHSGGEQFGLKW